MNATKRTLLIVALTFATAGFSAAQEEEVEPPKLTLITNVKVYDGTGGALIEGPVLVSGNLIKAVGADAKAVGSTVVDGKGGTVVPGLIDSHTHLSLVESLQSMEDMDWGEIGARQAAIAEDQLLRGFTTVRDLGGNTHGLRNAINKGAIPGPRVVSAGAFITARSGHGDFGGYTSKAGGTHLERLGYSHIVSGPAEVRDAIRQEMRMGASFIKLMMGGGLASPFDPLDVTTFSQAEVDAAENECQNWGTYATAHIYTDRGMQMGLDAGMRTFEHTHLASEEMYQQFAKKGIIISAQVHAISQLKTFPMFKTKTQKEKAAFLADNGTATFGYAKKYKVPLGFGADFWGNLEAQRTNSVGIPGRLKYFNNKEILAQIYANNVKLLEMCGERLPYRDAPLGTVKAGGYADLLIVDGDPFEDVGILGDWENKLKLVMKDGVIYRNEFE